MQEGQAKERERGAKEPTPKNIMKETRGWPKPRTTKATTTTTTQGNSTDAQ